VLFHLIGSEGLADVSASARRKRLHTCDSLPSVVIITIGYPFGALHRGNLPDKFQPVHDRHIDIAQDEINHVLCNASSASRPFEASTALSRSMPA